MSPSPLSELFLPDAIPAAQEHQGPCLCSAGQQPGYQHYDKSSRKTGINQLYQLTELAKPCFQS